MSRWKPNNAAIARAATAIGAAKVSKFNRETTNTAKYRVPRKTGRAANSIGSSMRITRSSIKGSVGSRVNYMAPLHEGALPHIIRARRKKALAFYWEFAGRRMIRKSVHHPGVGATPFLTSAAREAAARNGFRWRRSVVSRVIGV